MSEYMMEVKTTTDALHAAGSTITNKGVVGYVVDGLDASYRSLLSYLHFHPAMSFDELHTHLS